MYQLTNDPSLKYSARLWTEGLGAQQFLTQTHDIGFIIFSSYGNGFKTDSNETYHEVLLQAARSLMKRYNPVVGCIKSWDGRKWDFPVIIDNMMNLELLFWASKNGGTKEMYDAAFSHSVKTMHNHFRTDGSTYHVVDYDTLTGKVKSKETHQGYADESVWARGQAWAVYGFTMAYRETHNEDFLFTAEKAAEWFIDHLPKDKIPYWDFLVPDTNIDEKDVSAAAIVSSALFELSSLSTNKNLKQKFYGAAVKILSSLCAPPYLAEGTNSQGILNHAVGNHPKNSEINVSLIYADYYFLEAILRYQQTTKIY
jgi:unsaturated chondroitin disaccharide hydrolase